MSSAAPSRPPMRRERLPQDCLLGFELGGIVEVLPGAAATLRDVRARGTRRAGEGWEDLDGARPLDNRACRR